MNCPNCKKKNILKLYVCGKDDNDNVRVCDDCKKDRHKLAKK